MRKLIKRVVHAWECRWKHNKNIWVNTLDYNERVLRAYEEGRREALEIATDHVRDAKDKITEIYKGIEYQVKVEIERDLHPGQAKRVACGYTNAYGFAAGELVERTVDLKTYGIRYEIYPSGNHKRFLVWSQADYDRGLK